MKISSNYIASLKHPEAEEFLDLVLYRPLAYLLVKILVRFPVTPNQITIGSILVGILAGYCYSIGSMDGMIWGAALYGVSNVLDCSDGMIARLKRNGTEMGRIIDGFADYITSGAVYIGLGIGLTKGAFNLPYDTWMIVIATAISYALHAFLFDHFRNEFLARVHGNPDAAREEIENMEGTLTLLKHRRGQWWRRILITAYLRYSRLQYGEGRREDASQWSREEYIERNRFPLKLWSLIGSTTHVTAVIVATLLRQPMIFFVYSVIFGNLWCLALWLYQRSVVDGRRHRSYSPDNREGNPLRR